MEAAGFTVEIDHRDTDAGRTGIYPRDAEETRPAFALSFKKENLVVWHVVAGWQTARLEDGHYTGHRTFKTLEDVVNEFTPISSQDDLNEYADLLRRNGFTIIAVTKPGHSFTFEKDGNFGNIEAGYFYRSMANFSTEHKPSKGNGSGFGFRRDLDRSTALTLQNAIDCLKYASHATTARKAGFRTRSGEKAEPVKKWGSVQEYAESHTILGWRIYPPIEKVN